MEVNIEGARRLGAVPPPPDEPFVAEPEWLIRTMMSRSLSGDDQGCAAGLIRPHIRSLRLDLVHVGQELGIVARFLEGM